MAFKFDVVGKTIEPVEYRYTWKDTVLYALGIGAKADELDYLYEGRGPRVYPSFAVIAAQQPMVRALGSTEGPFEKIVHGAQRVTLHAAIPPEGTLKSTATIEGIYDLRRMAQVVARTSTVDAATGRPLFDTEWSILYLGEGGFGGEMRKEPDKTAAPSRAPDFRVEEATTAEQALLYRLSGDLNPLHADPDFPLVARFEGKPILHGLATYGFMVRAVAKAACGGDASRIRSIAARFARPVWPGQTLVTEGWVEGQRVFARTSIKERDEVVLSHVALDIAPAGS
jgi:acyl dehydratase